jgi:hypothetical protein
MKVLRSPARFSQLKSPLTEEAVNGELLDGVVRLGVVRHEGKHPGVRGLELHPLLLAHAEVLVALAIQPRRVLFLSQWEVDNIESKRRVQAVLLLILALFRTFQM